MSIIRVNELPEGSGSLSSDDVFLFMDDPSGNGVTKKISLSEINAAIGGGGGGNPFDQNLNTTDFPTFSGVNLNNNSSLAQGTYDNGTSGNGGISLNCTVGYELNWQGGHLKCTQDGGITSSNIILDSPLQFSDNVMICSTSDDLLLKYAAAKLLTPNGNSLSSTNRATLIIMPGVYPLTGQWEIDGEFVDIIGLGSSSLDRGCNVAVTVTDYDINVSANDVKLKGIGTAPDYALKIDGDKPLQVFEECKGGDNSFGGYDGAASGTFTNCSGGTNSFGGGGLYGSGSTASGTFTNCSGGDSSFGGGGIYGGGGTASGTFTNCSGGTNSFGSYGTASGIFKDCSGGGSSFGGGGLYGSGGTASGTFTNCSGGDSSFGGNGIYGGGGGTASGTFTNCSGGTNSFGSGGTASGIFKDCSGGGSSFGTNGTASGTFTNCSADGHSFGFGGTASGTFTNCSGGTNSFGGWGLASGTFTNCSADNGGFGGTGMAPGTASGKFLRCTLINGSFPPLTYPGIQRLCIDGSYNIVNETAVAP